TFFFQAEDGIRYFHVTGVQTCALPISIQVKTVIQPVVFHSIGQLLRTAGIAAAFEMHGVTLACHYLARLYRTTFATDSKAGALRSEERRVGKECRLRR